MDNRKYNQSLFDKIANTDIEQVMIRKGYRFFKGVYNLNIIGVRSKESVRQSNKFDDAIIVCWGIDSERTGIPNKLIFAATTDPGIKSLKVPMNAKGTAILVPGQYRGSHKLGLHQGKYEALVQCAPVKVYRDANKDSILDTDKRTIDTGMFGINIHKAGLASTIVDGWSAGCQVIAKTDEYEIFMDLCRKQKLTGYGDKFTYTLLEEKDLI